MNDRKIAVLKFGGSSLKTEIQRKLIVNRIISVKKSGYSVVVVLSAMGRFPDPYSTDTLIDFLKKACSEVEPMEKDLVMSSGEIFTCILIGNLLRESKQKIKIFTGFQAGIITDDNFTDATILSMDTEKLRKAFDDDYIAIVAGFQGMSINMNITTLGRGGSDTTATALGASLNASLVEIFTDVDGVMTADPKTYDKPKIIRELTYQEMGEMANEGAKVLHSRCVDLSKNYNVPLWVKGSFSNDRGSLVSSEIPQRKNVVTGIIHKTGIHEFILDYSVNKTESPSKLFKELANESVSLDLINLCYETIYFTVEDEQTDKVEKKLCRLKIPFKRIDGLAKVSCVGTGMKGTPGVMARIYSALRKGNIRILRNVDSYINISCLIEEKDLFQAIFSLHAEFGLDD